MPLVATANTGRNLVATRVQTSFVATGVKMLLALKRVQNVMTFYKGSKHHLCVDFMQVGAIFLFLTVMAFLK